MELRSMTTSLLASTAILLGTAGSAWSDVTAESVVAHYADIAEAKYSDSLSIAKALDTAIDAFLESPSEAKLSVAKEAWLAARVPYQQTEVYRFGNAIVDDWEGRVNAWPLDEGLIDYVDAGYGEESDLNSLYKANVIANSSLVANGQELDASSLSPEFLSQQLHEVGGIEANVATGYHAIEFLLWGQDLNGSDEGAGNRPWTDFSTGNCTGGNCDRRAQYLAAASDLLVADLTEMAGNWGKDGAARVGLATSDAKLGLLTMLTGMGSLSYGELAGERMKLGLLLHDPEEEHDCFSDNTHNSHLYDAVGIRNVYLGTYKRPDGSVVSGASLSALVQNTNSALDAEMRTKLDATVAAMEAMAERAETVEAYDQMIAEANVEGNAVVQKAIDALIDQTGTIEKVIAALDIGTVELEGSDSLDNPNAVFE